MASEPTIEARPDGGGTTDPPAVAPPGRWRWWLVVVALVTSVVAASELFGGVQPPPPPTGVLSAPSTTAASLRVAEPVPAAVDARLGPGHLGWATVPLGGSRPTAAGEVAGRLVLVVEDDEGVDRLAFVSGSTLIPGVEIGSDVHLLTEWRDRMVLVGSDDGGPVLHLQRADATLRRLPPPRFEDADVTRIADFAATPDRLVVMADGRADSGVWSSGDGVQWERIPELAGVRSIAGLSDGRVLAWLESGAVASADGRAWRPFTVPDWVPEARGDTNLWSEAPHGTGLVAVSGDGRHWQPVSLAPVLSGVSTASMASGAAGYAMAVPPSSGVDPAPGTGQVATSADGLVWDVVPVPTADRHPQVWVSASSYVIEGDDTILVGFTGR
jgi:hypothetical protein